MIIKKLLIIFLLCLSNSTLFAQAPSNDDCINALFIPLPADGATCLNSSNFFAASDGISNPCDNIAVPPGGHEVWYTFIASGPLNSISVTPTALNGAGQVSITVQNGNCASTYLTCDVSATPAGASNLAFNTIAGSQIYFSVTSILNDGDFVLCINSSAGTIVPGSDCTTASRLCDKSNFSSPGLPPGVVPPQPPTCFTPQNPIWYQFTVGKSGTAEFTATPQGGAGFRWTLFDITGSCAVPMVVACNSNYIPATPFGMSVSAVNCLANSFCPPANLTLGNTYALMVDDTASTGSGFDITWGGTFEIAPTAHFTIDSLVACGSLTANLTNTSSTIAGTTFTWDFDDLTPDFVGTTPTPHVYFSGTYIITLTDSVQGCKNFTSQQIKVFPKPTSTFTVDDDTICFNGTATSAFTYTGLSSPLSCTWNFGSGNLDFFSFPATWNVSWPAVGAQPVSLFVSENGCASDTTRDTVHVFNYPTSSFAFSVPNDSACLGDTVIVSYTGSAAANAQYAWSYGFGDTSQVTNQNFNVVWNTLGSGKDGFSVTVLENGCVSTTYTDSLTLVPTPAVAFTTNLIRACANEVKITEATQTIGSGGVYSWNFDGGITVPAAPVDSGPHAVSWSGAGDVIINVTVTQSGCTSDPAYDTLHVYPIPSDTFTISPKQLCGLDSTLISYADTAGSLASFSWSFPSGGTNPANPLLKGPYKITYPAPGQYLVSLQVTDSLCTSAGRTDTVTVGPYPNATILPDTATCSNTPVFIGGVAVVGYTYSWTDTAGVFVSNSPNPSVFAPNFSLQDSVITYYQYITQGFCTVSDTVEVTIHPRQLSSFSPPASQCQNESSIDFSSSSDSIPGSTYQWNFGPNATPLTSTLASPTDIHFNSDGLQFITLTTQSPGCATDVFSDTIRIDESPVVSFFVNDTANCPPFDVQFTDITSPLGGSTYLWDFGNGDTSTASNPLYNYPFSGFYQPTLTYTTAQNCSTTDTLVTGITVFPAPDPTFQALPPITDDLNPTILFNYEEPNSTCLYDFGDGTIGTECIMPHTYQDTGVYFVTMIVITANGCTDTSYQTVEVKSFYTFYIPSGFTPNADGRNDVFGVQGIGIADFELDVFNRRGQLIYKSVNPYETWNGTYLNTGNNAPEGVYVYVMKTKDVNNKKHAYKGRVTLVR